MDPAALSSRFCVVLSRTSHPGNIGASARAMKNMGLSRLYLVAPEKFPDEQAVWRAAAAGDLLERAVITASVEEAIGDQHGTGKRLHHIVLRCLFRT